MAAKRKKKKAMKMKSKRKAQKMSKVFLVAKIVVVTINGFTVMGPPEDIKAILEA